MQHQFNPTILREYDVRGIVGDTLKVADARALGLAFGSEVRAAGGSKIALGFDGRLSSPELQKALADGLMSTGCDVLSIGLSHTPMLYFAVYHLAADAGVQITGSHNPPDYNGFKMMLGQGPFFGESILHLGRRAATGDFVSGQGARSEHDVMDAYIDRLLQDLDLPPLDIAWDPGNGAAGPALEKLLPRLPGKHVLINGEVDGTFPNHHPDPTDEKTLGQLKDTVAGQGLDLGLGFDGDGDRIGAIDSRGNVVWGDQLLAIMARDVLTEVPGATIIADVKASQVLFDEIARAGGQPVMWKTGHSLIKEKMAEMGAPLAGEMSGHIFYKHGWYGFDDAVYAALRLLQAVGRLGGSLDSLYDSLPKMINTPEIRFPCPEDRKFAVADEVRARLADATNLDVDTTDGVRVTGPDGWWLLRASNTQDVLVARCEAQNIEGLERLKAVLVAQLTASNITPPEDF